MGRRRSQTSLTVGGRGPEERSFVEEMAFAALAAPRYNTELFIVLHH